MGARPHLPVRVHRYEAAMGAEKVIAFNPNFAEGHTALGFILHHVGPVRRGPQTPRTGGGAEPQFPRQHATWLHFRAQALYQLGRYPEAVGLLKRRIVLRNPETDASRVLLAACYGQMSMIEEAREAWREALHVNPAYSLEQRRKVLPNPNDFERVVEGAPVSPAQRLWLVNALAGIPLGACFTQVEIDCAVGSNSRASSSGVRADRTRSTICRRNSGG